MGAKDHSRESMTVESPSLSGSLSGNSSVLVAAVLAALVLGLFLADAVGWRARWVAGGLVILGLGHFVFGYLELLIQEDPPELNESLYEAFVTQTLACALFMVALFPGRPSRLVVWAPTGLSVALMRGRGSRSSHPGLLPEAWSG